MAKIPIDNLGVFGLNTDINIYDLPPEMFNSGSNVRFTEKGVTKGAGYVEVFNPLSIAPYHVMGAPGASNYHWVYPGLTAIYSVTGATHTDRTRTVGGAYTGTANDKWTSCMFNGIAVVNNGVDDPQFWVPDVGTDFADLTDWPASTTCKIIRSYLTFLIALDITQSGSRYPSKVKWSHTADPGSLPNSWDATDVTKLAGEYNLSETAGYAKDGLSLKNMFLIYKEDSVWGMQFIGAPAVFRFWNVTYDYGILATNCVASVGDGGHVFLARNDVCFTDGQQTYSIIDLKRRKALFNDIDSDNYEKCFVWYSKKKKEVWICYPTTGNTWCNKAYVWNVKTKAWGVQELPNLAHAANGLLDAGDSQVWNDDTNTWDTDTTVWDERTYDPTKDEVMAVSPTNSKAYHMYNGQSFDGSAFTTVIIREGIALAGMDRHGNPKVDKTSTKYAGAIWPKIDAQDGTVFTFYMGEQEHINGSMTWNGPYTYTVGSDTKVDVGATGRALGFRMECSESVEWHMAGYTLDIQVVGDGDA